MIINKDIPIFPIAPTSTKTTVPKTGRFRPTATRKASSKSTTRIAFRGGGQKKTRRTNAEQNKQNNGQTPNKTARRRRRRVFPFSTRGTKKRSLFLRRFSREKHKKRKIVKKEPIFQDFLQNKKIRRQVERRAGSRRPNRRRLFPTKIVPHRKISPGRERRSFAPAHRGPSVPVCGFY